MPDIILDVLFCIAAGAALFWAVLFGAELYIRYILKEPDLSILFDTYEDEDEEE